MDIVEEIRNDRERGARRLESEYKAGLMALARRFCPDEGDAEELVNSTFAEVVASIDRYAEQSAFFAWMARILVRRHGHDTEHKSNKTVALAPEIAEGATDPAAEARIFSEVDASILRDAIHSLPQEIRNTVVMHYFMDIPVREAAKVLNVPTGTIAWRLHYARMLLAAKLGAAAKKPGGKALLIALALCGLTALGAATSLAVVRLLSPVPAARSLATAPLREGDGGGAAGGSTPTAAQDRTGGTGGTGGTGEASAAEAASVPPVQSSFETDSFTIQTLQEKQIMNTAALRTLTASAAFATMTSAAIPANANTVAWWHFDEKDPGTTATEAIAASGTSSVLSATPVSFSDATPTASSGDWLPAYAKPFQGLAVYDPVTDTTRTNRAAMKFRTSESGKYGGALHAVTKTSDVYGSTANAITVEAFVCTTGGVYSTFAPIVACMEYENWTSEKWAIYEEADGTLALRFDGSPYYSGNSGQAGTAKINDGAWHHVAFVIDGDGRQERTYVDGRLSHRRTDFDLGVTSDIVSLFVGCGYEGNPGWKPIQFFDGWVDNLRVTKRALGPEEFLSAHPFGKIGDGPQPLLLAQFNGDYDLTCASNADFSVTGRGDPLYDWLNCMGSSAGALMELDDALASPAP